MNIIKKLISILLSLILVVVCLPTPAQANNPTQNISFPDNALLSNVDSLFALRAALLNNPETSQQQIEEIDNQLVGLGLEKISYEEVAQKMGQTVQPMYNVSSTADTTWFSLRRITVHYGQRYEVQIITGQMRDPSCTSSKLYSASAGIEYTSPNKQSGSITALKILANEVTTASISAVSPVIGATLTVGETLFNMVKAYHPGITSSTNLGNAKYTYVIGMVTIMKYAFVKNEGALDAGNQVKCYVGNSVQYSITITIPIVINDNGTLKPTTTNKTYSDTATSYSFSNDDCVILAAQNYWYYKQGYPSSMDPLHEILIIPMTFMDTRYRALVPSDFPVIS